MMFYGVESGRGLNDLFIAVEGVSRTVWGGWSTTVVRALILAQDRKRWDEPLLKDEADVASSSWLHEKKARHNAVVWRHRPKERRRY
jgi:hypothetical protein